MPPPPLLTVDRWTLRPLTPADTEAWFAIIQDPQLRQLTSWNIDDVDVLRSSIEAITSGARSASTRRWAIVDEGGALIGTGGFKDWDAQARTAEIVYELAADQRGRGTMTTLGRAMIEQGLGPMQLSTITALVMVDNVASRRLLERLGFHVTETLPAFRDCAGVRKDFVRYTLAASATPAADHD